MFVNVNVHHGGKAKAQLDELSPAGRSLPIISTRLLRVRIAPINSSPTAAARLALSTWREIFLGWRMGIPPFYCSPERLLDELVRQRKSELSIISNDAAVPGKGVGKLFDAALVSTDRESHIGLNPHVQKQMMANKVAVNLVPQGTFVNVSAPVVAASEVN